MSWHRVSIYIWVFCSVTWLWLALLTDSQAGFWIAFGAAVVATALWAQDEDS